MEIQPPAICVSICEENLNSFEQAILNARPHANVIELRLDCLNPLQMAPTLGSWTLYSSTPQFRSSLRIVPLSKGTASFRCKDKTYVLAIQPAIGTNIPGYGV